MLRSFLTTAFYRAASTQSELPGKVSGKWLELQSLHRFITTRRIDLIIDVGANEGQFAAKVRRLGYRGRIVSIEPDPRAYAMLAARHGADSLWKGHQLALGADDQTLKFNTAHHSVLSSFLSPVNSETVASQVDVPVRRLDGMWSELTGSEASARVFLKTDTQGYDLQVLRGATGCLPRVMGILAELPVLPIYEESPTLPAALAEYSRAGFDLLDLSIVNRTPDGRVLEFDGLFTNRAMT
jgi:FkbM family methyltransferase